MHMCESYAVVAGAASKDYMHAVCKWEAEQTQAYFQQ